MLAAAVAYSAVVGLEALWHGVVATPDMLLVALMPLALLTGRFITWLKDWVPFVGLLLGWEAMRSIADTFSVTGVRSRPTNGTQSLRDRKSTRLNSSHVSISYAVF